MSDNSTSSSGIGLCGMTFLVFLTLKLTGTIDWSWWLVTAPLWGGAALAIAGVLLVLAIAGVLAAFSGRK